MKFSPLPFATLCWAVKCGQTHMWMNIGNVVMWSVNWCWPCLVSPTLAWLTCQSWYVLTSKICSDNWFRNPDIRERECLKPLIKTFCHKDLDLFALGFSICMRFCVWWRDDCPVCSKQCLSWLTISRNTCPPHLPIGLWLCGGHQLVREGEDESNLTGVRLLTVTFN